MYHPADQFFRRTIQRTPAKINSDMNCQPLQSGDIYVFNIRRPFSYCNIVIIPYNSNIIATSFTALEIEPCFAIFLGRRRNWPTKTFQVSNCPILGHSNIPHYSDMYWLVNMGAHHATTNRYMIVNSTPVWWFGPWILFFHNILGMPSSQLTNSYFSWWLKPPTSSDMYNMMPYYIVAQQCHIITYG